MELDKNTEQELAALIADPQKVSTAHLGMLNELLHEYPYYQPLYLLLAETDRQQGKTAQLAKAALYTSGKTLHHFLYGAKTPLAEPEIIRTGTRTPLPDAAARETAETVSPRSPDLPESAENLPVTPSLQDAQETPGEIAFRLPGSTEENIQEEPVFEEISEVDYQEYRPFRNGESAGPVPAEATGDQDDVQQKSRLQEDFVFESIASTDFFAFEQNFSPAQAAEPQLPEPAPVIEEHDDAAAEAVAHGRVSNYHDDQLPYTFLWWLAKTRKEHESIIQPYAVPKKNNSPELQQQYVEHIFHLQSHLPGGEELPEDTEMPKSQGKDVAIIDSFIKNDPQINPPNAEQIDNENKAKKSAEDQNDLVSETLANIYIEQMLYDKAIDTYEKLSLKFPEKSRYFADLIQSIEKKI